MYTKKYPLLLLLFLALAFTMLPRASVASSAETTPTYAYELTLGEQTFDPLSRQPALDAAWQRTENSGKQLRMVQFDGPTKDAWLTSLEAQGLEVVQYIHPFTYVVWGDEAALSSASRSATNIRWTGNFEPAYSVLPQYRTISAESAAFDILLYRGANADSIVGQLTTLGASNIDRGQLNKIWEVATLTISGSQVNAMAQIPGVYSVQPVPTDGGLRGEMTNQISADNVAANNAAFPGYAAYLNSIGLDGTGVIMANVDGGIQETHPDLVNNMLPCVGSTCGGSATDSHGTHTAGVMAGDGASGTVDSNGFLRGQGVAPGANLVEQVYSPTFFQANGMLTLMRQSFDNNAVLSGNSWGPAGTPRGYDNDTLQVDIGVRDADPDAAGNQQFTYVLSFMNGGGGTSSQGTPDEAKNLFNIGSTKGQQSNGQQILDINDLSANSAHGPALDGRTIPHMVAPGCNVDSTVPTNSYGVAGWCGTSMASPHVSGAVGLFIEHYRNLFSVDPTPALIKAAFLPVAHDLAGFDDADGLTMGHRFDSKQGWGRLNIDAVVNSAVDVIYLDNPQIFSNTGESWSDTFMVADPSQPVRLMLVWTDAPGHGLGGSTPAWNNNLDLSVTAGGQTFVGNNFGTGGWSVAGGSADSINNTEGIFFDAGQVSGSFTIQVNATNITSDAIPGDADTTDQDFSLVCYNCSQNLQPGFAMFVTPNPLNLCIGESGTASLQVGQTLGFADPINFSLSGVPADVVAGLSSTSSTAPASIDISIDASTATAGSAQLTVTGTAGALVETASMDLNITALLSGAPSLSSPPNGLTDVTSVPTFAWSSVTGATDYLFELAKDPGFNDVVDTSSTTNTSYTPSITGEIETNYYWRVTAQNGCGTLASSTFTFSTPGATPTSIVLNNSEAINSSLIGLFAILAVSLLGVTAIALKRR